MGRIDIRCVRSVVSGLVAAWALFATPLIAQAPAEPIPELTGFARLVGGQWHLGEDSYNTFEWGIGGRALKAEGFFLVDGQAKRVSEITFAYHPGEAVVKGHGVAIDMGLDYFEYDVRFQGDTIMFDLQAFGPAAPPGALRETWVFTDEDRYEWTLLAPDGNGGWQRSMAGTFVRRRRP